MGILDNGYPCHPCSLHVVALAFLQRSPPPNPEFSSWVGWASVTSRWTRWSFSKNHQKKTFLIALLLNPSPVKKPSLATEYPTNTLPARTMEWIQHLKGKRDSYCSQALSAIVNIRDCMAMPLTNPRLTIPPPERINHLCRVLDVFLPKVNGEIKLVRQSSRRSSLRRQEDSPPKYQTRKEEPHRHCRLQVQPCSQHRGQTT